MRNFYLLTSDKILETLNLVVNQSIKNVLENRNELTQVSEYITSLAKCTTGLYSRSHIQSNACIRAYMYSIVHVIGHTKSCTSIGLYRFQQLVYLKVRVGSLHKR